MLVKSRSSGFGLDPLYQTTEASLWEGVDLVNAAAPPGSTLTEWQQYEFYSGTPEGQAILSREEIYYDTTRNSLAQQRLFVARVQYNRSEGGIELFAEFMPRREALISYPEQLAAYDEQLERILNHVENDSFVSENGKALDPSLQFIVASGMSKVLAHRPDLVGRILSDLDKGWRIELEATYGGLYTMRQPLFESVKSKIHYRLDH